MSVVFVRGARTSFFLVVLIILDYGREAKSNDEFGCPVKCSTDVYRPICLRGKSYANLCVLKQDICSGKIARELYNDVEACPGYKKDEDADGASVEAIDKNGVLFRNLIDYPVKTVSSSPATDLTVAESIDFSTTERTSRRRVADRKRERFERMRFCRQTCSTRDTYHRPVDVLRTSSLCGIKFLDCRCRIQACRCRDSGSSGALEESGPLVHFRRGSHRLSGMTSVSKYSRSGTLTVARFLRKNCRINCDPNEYRPIHTARHVIRYDCSLTRGMRGIRRLRVIDPSTIVQ